MRTRHRCAENLWVTAKMTWTTYALTIPILLSLLWYAIRL
jgi:hypothetical protein